MATSRLNRLLLVLTLAGLSIAAVGQDFAYQRDAVARFHLNNGKYLVDRGEYLEANAEFGTALDTAVSDALKAESLASLGQVSVSFLDQPAVALGYYERITAQYRSSEFYPTALFQLGMVSYERQDIKSAQQWFRRFQHEFPGAPQAPTAAFMLARIDEYLSRGELPPLPPAPAISPFVRVRLDSLPEARISAGDLFRAPALGRVFKREVAFTVRDGNVAVAGERLGAGPIELTADRPFRFKGRSYRGTILLSANNNHVLVVNRVPIEQYLYSVVGSEMPSNWPLEALKAQAIAARTYAAYMTAHPPNAAFDLFDNIRDQQYNGIKHESDSTRKVVDETSGKGLAYAGRAILAAFTANNGGRSSESSSIYRVSYPYFQVREDPYSRLEPFGHWERRFTAREIQHALADYGFDVGSVTNLRVAEADKSGRASWVDVVFGERSLRLRGRTQFRTALNRYAKQHNLPENVPDTLITISRSGEIYTLAGGGWGHGVGMSQYGAKARARAGQDHFAILQEYYPLTKIVRLY